MKKIFFLIIFFFPFLCRAQQTFTMNQGIVKLPGYYTEIGYENVRDKIIIKAVIGKKTYRFIVDTGAPTMITQTVFDELKLAVLKKLEINDANGSADSLIVTNISEIKLGDVMVNDIPALVAKDPLIFNCHKVDGFIGSNLLRNSIISFSSKDHKLILTDQVEKLSLNKKQSADLILNKAQSSPFIDIKLTGSKSGTLKVLFDSGMEGLLDISLKHYAILEKKNIFTLIGRAMGNSTLGVNGIGRDTSQYRLNVKAMNINGALLKNVTMQTTASDNSRIGSELLHYGTLTLDYINKLLYFNPYTDNIDIAKKVFPISVTIKDKKLIVALIWDENLQKELSVDDQILFVDDKDYSNIDPCEFIVGNSIFEGKNKLVITVKNKKGEIKKVEIYKV